MNNKYTKFFPYITLILISIILLSNMFYSFSWTDEGLYLSNVHRFLQGVRPLIDDWTPTQFYAPLLYPLYTLFYKLNGSSESSILFFRIITVIFQTLSAVFVYSVLYKKNSKLISFFASSLILIFSRACLNGPSYYTIGLTTYFLGLICIYAVFSLFYNRLFLFLAGLFFAAAILCNPFLVLSYFAYSILAIAFKKSRGQIKKIALIWAGSIFAGIAYCAFVFYGNSLSDILNGLHYTYNDPSYKHTLMLTIKRLYKMPRLLVFPYVITWLPMIVSAIIVKIKKIQVSEKTTLILHILNALVLFANCFYNNDIGSAIMCFFHFVIFESILFSKLSAKEFFTQFKTELLYFVIPGMILAYFFCFASDTGFGVCSIGMAVAAIGELLIYWKIAEHIRSEKSPFITKTVKTIPVIILFLFTFFFRTNNVYRDSNLSNHLFFIPNMHTGIAKIENGPAKGIYTTIENKKHYDNLYSLLSELNSDKEKTIFISGTATWAYMARPNIKCSAPTTWRTFFDDVRLQTYYEEFPKKSFPDYVLILNPKNPSNGGRYKDKNDEESIKNTWLYSKLQELGYSKKEYPSGILYSAE